MHVGLDTSRTAIALSDMRYVWQTAMSELHLLVFVTQ